MVSKPTLFVIYPTTPRDGVTKDEIQLKEFLTSKSFDTVLFFKLLFEK